MSLAEDFIKRKKEKNDGKINAYFYVSHEEYNLKDFLSELPDCIKIKDVVCENRSYLLEIESKNDFMILKDIVDASFKKKTDLLFKKNDTLNNFFDYPNYSVFEDRQLKTIEEKIEDFNRTRKYKESLIKSHFSLKESSVEESKKTLSLLMSKIYNIEEDKSKIFIDFVSNKINSFFKKNPYFDNHLFLNHLYSDFNGEFSSIEISQKTYDFNRILENQKKDFSSNYNVEFIEKITQGAISKLNITEIDFEKNEKIDNNSLLSKIPSIVSFSDYESFSFFDPNYTKKYDFESLVPFVREINSVLLSYKVEEYRTKVFSIFDKIKNFDDTEIMKTLDEAINFVSQKKQERKINNTI